MLEFSTNLRFNLPADGSFPGEWGDPLNDNFITIDGLFGPQGHDHSGDAENGPKLNHANLLGIGINSHDAIDAHMACLDLHQDIQIGAVGESALNGATFLNVSELRFANSTVTSLGSGVVVVTPTGGGGGTPLEQSAPVVHYDAFSAPVGTPLTKQNYIVFSGGANPPTYVSSSEGGVDVGDIPVSGGVAGFCTNLLDGFHPHSKIQRVGVVVAEHQPNNPVADDSWELHLHLLASDDTPDINTPVKEGISLVLRVTPGVAAPTLRPTIVVRSSEGQATYSTPFPAPSGFSHPTGGSNWDELPYQFINGHHEFSLSIPPNNPDSFYLNYYYNSGLIFRHEFSDALGSSERALYNAVTGLLEDFPVASPATPSFGRVGWSTKYSFAGSGGPFRSNIKAVMASSTGEQVTPRVVGLPEGVDTSVAVCGGNQFVGTVVGGQFDPDADTVGGVPPDAWTVTSTFSAQGPESAGFIISDGAGGLGDQRIYCDTPTGGDSTNAAGEPDPVCVTSNYNGPGGPPAPLTLRGLNLPPAEFVDIEFELGGDTAINDKWYNGGSGTSTTAPNAALPDGFLELSVADQNGNDLSGVSEIADTAGSAQFPSGYQVRVRGGGRLPLDTLIDVKITSKYNPDYSTRIENAFKVCPVEPYGVTTSTFRYDPTAPDDDGPRGRWVPYAIGDAICEGEYFLFFIDGLNLPIGDGFHQGAAKFDISTGATASALWGVDDTTRMNLLAGTGTGLLVEVLDSGFIPGKFPADADGAVFVGADPEQNPTPTSGDPWTIRSGDGEQALKIREGLFILGKLQDDAWSRGGPDFVRLNVVPRGLSGTQYNFIAKENIKPRPPAISIDTPLDDTDAGATPGNLNVTVEYADDDFVLKFPSGWANAPAGGVTGELSGVTVTNGTQAYEQIWELNFNTLGITVSANVGEAITLQGENVAAESALAGQGVSNGLPLGEVGEAAPQTPVIVSTAGSAEEGVWRNISVVFVQSSLDFVATPTAIVPPAQILSNSGTFGVGQSGWRPKGGPGQGTIVGSNQVQYIYEVLVRDLSPFGDLPADAFLRISNSNGAFDDTADFAIQTVTPPVINDISLESLDNNASPVTDVPLGELADVTEFTIFVEAENFDDGTLGGFELSFSDQDGGGGEVPRLLSTEFIRTVGDVSTYQLNVGDLGGLSVGDSIAVTVRRDTLGGRVYTNTSASSITFSAGLTNPGNGIDGLPAAHPGRYASVSITGVFSTSAGPDPITGSGFDPGAISVELLERGTSNRVDTQTTVISWLADRLFFISLLADNTLDVLNPNDSKQLDVKLTFGGPFDAGVVVTTDAYPLELTAPPEPTLDNISPAVLSGEVVGNTNETLTITGPGLVPGITADPGFGSTPLDFGFSVPAGIVQDGDGTFVPDAQEGSSLFFERVDVTSAIALQMVVDYLGGYTKTLDLGITTQDGTGSTSPPGTSNLTTDGGEESGGNDGQFRSAGSTTTFTLTGTGLGSRNVATDDGSSPVQLVVAGFSNNAGGDLPESPPGEALHPDVTNKAFTDVTIVSQSDTQIVARATLSNIFVDTKLRVRLSRPASHPDGAGYWTDEEIDLITPGDETHPGMTLDGPSTTLLAPNSIPSVGSTRRDFATAFQTALGPNSDGSTFSVTLRLTQALTQAPVVVAVPDPTYGATLSGITVTPTASPFEWQISGRVPTPSQVNGYPASTWRAAFPVSVGLTLRNGIPIASAVLGSPLTLSPGGGGATPIP